MSSDEVAAGPADALYLLLCTGYHGQWWNHPGGYGIDPGDAKVWSRDDAVAQIRRGHERGEVAVPADAFMWQFARLADQAFRIWRKRGPIVHELKTWPRPFEAVWQGAKRAELRRDDRGFDTGDLLVLREWKPPEPGTIVHEGDEGRAYTGRRIEAIITHVLRDGQFGVLPGFVMLSILPFPRECT